ncbi:NAD-dependent deacetylase [Mariniphaga anaerophila]|uniref:protein acetyllysine N-acetyltransferase n=1 Tax=Mariniphaga anaerophila TaxID=1484053 RepID=A0A1M4SYL9_9BACT|nr:NAD-dependent deacylase [Mariniphaga anaerophila]SHE37301.1 NAD-dependent deacetylase [Mariniphaga anaerophila]
MPIKDLVPEVASIIKDSNYLMAFTGAGVSVESGIPPFRGPNGLWNKYDPEVLNLDYFLENPEECWFYISEIFYDFFSDARPNKAHLVLAHLEKDGLLKSLVTQNIDNLHQQAGSLNVHEFHGNSKRLKCLKCGKFFYSNEFDFNKIPPRCDDDGEILKPDFIFFGEGIPRDAYENSFADAEKADVCIIVGSTGEVTPASFVPRTAKQNGAVIIEINPEETLFTEPVTDIHLKGTASDVLARLELELL